MSCSCCSQESKTKIFEPFIDRFALLGSCRMDNGPKNFKNPLVGPQSNDWKNCKLQSLPIELYQACLQYLDLATLTAMRRVSQYTRHTIDTLYQYQELYEHAPQALRACLSTGVAPHISIRRLHHSLTTMECYYCKSSDLPQSNFGSYLSLYEGRRSCLFCIRNNPELKPVELMALITLRCQRNSSIRNTDNLPLINTIPGSYTPLPNAPPRFPRTTLLRGFSITANPGTTLNEKEHRALFGNTRTATTYHHPLVSPNDESDISPAANYVAPDTLKQISHLYMSAILFPYLTSSKTISDYGILCSDCCLHMRYNEYRWKEEQNIRRMNGQDPTASLRIRERINGVRRKACKMYTVSEEARSDEWEMKRGVEVVVMAGGGYAMSMHEHRLVHAKEKPSRSEMEWRQTVKGPPLPLLRHDRFG